MNNKDETDFNQIKMQPCDLCQERHSCKLYNLSRPISSSILHRRTVQQRLLSDYPKNNPISIKPHQRIVQQQLCPDPKKNM